MIVTMNETAFPKQHGVNQILVYLFFLAIQLLFLNKYGARYQLPLLPLSFGYALALLALLLFREKIIYLLDRWMNPVLYWIVVVLGAVASLWALQWSDRMALNVDRWSALQSGLEALFNGQYPYTAKTHLNHMSSNFPGTLLLDAPFYALGDVAYLGVFAFVLFAFALYKTLPKAQAFYILVLLFASIVFWYEMIVVSDFMPNILILISFLLLWRHYFEQDLFQRPILLALFLSILVLTRGIVWIPLLLFFAPAFFKTSNSRKLQFIIAFIVFAALVFGFAFMHCPDWETFKNFNPYLVQTAHSSSLFNVLALVLSLVISFRIKTQASFYLHTVYIITVIMILIILNLVFKLGFYEVLINNVFDIVYLACALPFAWLYLTLISKKKKLA